MERLSTGVSSLDRLIEGGIPRGFFIAAVGEPGTGKTVLSIHFIAQGIKSDDLNIYVTTEESRESIIKQAGQFSFNFEDAIKNKKLVMIDALMGDEEWSLKHLDIDELVDMIIQAKKFLGYGRTRLVIDSLSAFWLAKPSMARQYSYSLKKILSKWDLTTLVTSQYAITTSIDGREPVIVKNDGDIMKIPIHKLYEEVNIGEINLNNLMVLSMDENLRVKWSPVLSISRHVPKEPLYKISLEDGSEANITGDHSIYIANETTISLAAARDIKSGDLLVTLKEYEDLNSLIKSDPIYLKVSHVDVLKRDRFVYDLEVSETQNFFAGSRPVLCHNSEAFGFGVEHIADGILRFRKSIKGNILKRYILVEKMRQTNHSLYLYEVHIMPGKGLIVTSPTTLRREDLALPNNVKRKISKYTSDKEIK